jgi:hypothetical protein
MAPGLPPAGLPGFTSADEGGMAPSLPPVGGLPGFRFGDVRGIAPGIVLDDRGGITLGSIPLEVESRDKPSAFFVSGICGDEGEAP